MYHNEFAQCSMTMVSTSLCPSELAHLVKSGQPMQEMNDKNGRISRPKTH
jgi:hypothetical protein